ncbi:2-polyprenyl-3-methyl-6-methoxy-1,4-benzoquinone monooxygenase [Undibacterium sp. TJN25]|uniref:2-polyprenyl-3-methyl-6-methoxy-1,4-benzoquinone monooxygenase n=1 Tax=Undibacterium sp. TJN25 TaxID=3413056 RepID=UPI003BEF7727
MLPFNLDQLVLGFDRALRVVSGQAAASRANPAADISHDALSDEDKRHSAGLMRINHVGEVCAQALYDAQSLFSNSEEVKRQFMHSGMEEEDHLAWTAQRLQELGSRPSLLNPLWYTGAFACGAIAARCGDQASLGFVVETERQVEAHLESHLEKLPADDAKSRAIVDKMRTDEIAHGAAAAALGASSMPPPVHAVMKAMARVMTATAYYV